MKNLLLLLSATLLITQIGCESYSQEDLDNSVSSASSIAYDEGYSDGFADGREQGIADGYERGLSIGKQQAINEAEASASSAIDSLYAQLEQPYPETGTILTPAEEYCVAPLTINNPTSSAYVIKLVPVGEVQGTTMSFFVSPETTAEVLVPLGDYKIKCAYGTGPWYGSVLLFGESTAAEVFSDTFNFTSDTSNYYGYTISLKEVYGGNLDSIAIDVEDF